ncbi:hypothetical protein ACSSS7_007919 [Eimeria intestinalis]
MVVAAAAAAAAAAFSPRPRPTSSPEQTSSSISSNSSSSNSSSSSSSSSRRREVRLLPLPCGPLPAPSSAAVLQREQQLDAFLARLQVSPGGDRRVDGWIGWETPRSHLDLNPSMPRDTKQQQPQQQKQQQHQQQEEDEVRGCLARCLFVSRGTLLQRCDTQDSSLIDLHGSAVRVQVQLLQQVLGSTIPRQVFEQCFKRGVPQSPDAVRAFEKRRLQNCLRRTKEHIEQRLQLLQQQQAAAAIAAGAAVAVIAAGTAPAATATIAVRAAPATAATAATGAAAIAAAAALAAGAIAAGTAAATAATSLHQRLSPSPVDWSHAFDQLKAASQNLEDIPAVSFVGSVGSSCDSLQNYLTLGRFARAMEALGWWCAELNASDKRETALALALADQLAHPKQRLCEKKALPQGLTKRGFVLALEYLPFNLPEWPVG